MSSRTWLLFMRVDFGASGLHYGLIKCFSQTFH